MRRLDVLQPKDLFRYACPEDVGEMPASGNGHFCGTCSKVVVDLSCATFEEAVDTLRSATKSTCVSYAVEASGKLVFRDLVQGAKVVTVAAFLAACQAPTPDARAVPSAPPAVAAAPIPAPLPTAVSAAPAPTAPSRLPASQVSPGWPSAIAEPPVASPAPGKPVAPVKPRQLAGKPAPRPAMLSGEPMLPQPPHQTIRGEIAVPDDIR